MARRNSAPVAASTAARWLRPHTLVAELALAYGSPTLGAGLLAMLGSLAMPAWAGPQGASVVAGQASVQQSGALTTVHQASQRAVIDWRSFNLSATETVRFNQPGAQAATLNRVLGSDPSAILGRIQANGQVFLVNPNGIVFGRSARVDVGALVASTANVGNADFMAGRLAFTQPGRAGAAVVNEGRITVADGGLAALLGPVVANHGLIQARLGRVALAAGEAFTLDLRGDQLIQFVLGRAALDGLADADGRPLAARLDHSGQILADGGMVQLSAASASRLLDSVIQVGGEIRATSFQSTPGRIALRGDSGTRLTLAGTLDVSGERGGQIAVTAGDVLLSPSARLDASGLLGGGSVSLGGHWQGSGALPHANQLQVAAGAHIDASALHSGDGGTVVLWADQTTRFAGEIAARGGALGGQGGQVEVSGKQGLAFDGDVDASAAHGRAGRLLLDPANLVVDGSSGTTSLPGSGGGDVTLRASTINRQLQRGTSVTLQADNDIRINANAQIDARGGAAVAGAGLTLDAGRDISLNGAVILSDGQFEAVARGGSFSQAAAATLATGSGAVDIRAAGAISASNLLSTGAVTLASSGGAVQVSEALGAATNGGLARLATLTASGTSIRLDKDALVQGALALTASAGGISTATLDSRSSITLQARDSVATGALLTPGAVLATSTAGGISLGSVASEATDAAGFASHQAAGLTVRAAGAVALAGAALGAGGLQIDGATGAGSRAASASFSAAGVFSSGAVLVNTSGDIGLVGNAGIDGAATLALHSSGGSIHTGSGALKAGGAVSLAAAGALAVGSGGVQARAAGADALVLSAGGTATLDGRIESAGAARISASGSADAHVLANADIVASGITVLADGRFDQAAAGKLIDAGSGALRIQAAGAISAGNLFTSGSLLLASSGASVTVSGPLGRAAAGGGAPARLGGLTVEAATDLSLGAALVAGSSELSAGLGAATAGQLRLLGTLDSTGAITLLADQGIRTQALMGGSSIRITSGKAGADAVTLGPVSGSITGNDQALGADSPRAGALSIGSNGDLALRGGAAVASLTVTGPDPAGGSRAGGAVVVSGGSIFSTGAVDMAASGPLSLVGSAGISSGAALTLSSSGNLGTAGGGLRAAGAVRLVAGSTLTVGDGGVLAQAAGADALVLQAGGTVDLAGTLQSAGAVRVQATADVLARADVQAALGVQIGAGGRFEQAAITLIDAGSGPLAISTVGTLAGSNLVSTGELSLTSTGASVGISQALGRTDSRLGGLRISAATDVALAAGTLVGDAAAQITAGAGGTSGMLTLGGALDSRGSITLQARDALQTAALLTPGAVQLTSTHGGVAIGAVASQAASADEVATSRAGALTLRSAGDVLLGGGAAVASLDIGGNEATPGARAGGSVRISGGSVYSSGAVAIGASGPISIEGTAGMHSGAAIRLDSGGAISTADGGLQATTTATLQAAGTLTVGSGGVRADGSGATALVLASSGSSTLNGKLQADGGGLTVTTTGAAADVLANAGMQARSVAISAGRQFSQGAADLAIDAGTGALTISAAGALAATNLMTAGALTLTSTGASVHVGAALGRVATAGDARTRLGALAITAATGVELAAGALVAGTSTLTAGQGAASSGALLLGGTLDSLGSISLAADNGVRTQALMGGAAITVTSSKTGADAVRLGPVSGHIAGANQVLDTSSAKAGALTAHSAGDLAFSGGAAVASLDVTGPDTGTGPRSGGALAFSGGSIFSTGAIHLDTAGAIVFSGSAGASSASGAVALDSRAAIQTGSGGLQAATTALLQAGSTLLVGSGGVQAGANGDRALVLEAGGTTTLDGKLQARNGQIVLTTTGATSAVQANAGIDAAALQITAGGSFGQAANGLAIDAGSGALVIAAQGALSAHNLFSAGAVTLTSHAAGVSVGQALGRSASQADPRARLGALTVDAATDITLAQGALVAGSSTLTAATAGSSGAITLGGTLDSRGAILLDARDAVQTAALLSPGNVSVRSTHGPVTLGAVASDASTADTFASHKAGALVVRSGGNVALNGGAAVASVLVAGIDAAPGSNAGGTVGFSGGSVFSTGDVNVRAVGDIRFTGAAGMASSAGMLALTSRDGSITTASGPLSAAGALQLSGTSLTLGPADAAGSFVPDPANPNAVCSAGCPSGGLTAGADLTLTASSGGIAAFGKLQTAGGTISATAPGLVALNHVSTWQSGPGDMASGALVVAGADVVLTQGLGGSATGYGLLASGYQRSNRPAVGRVDISAANGVELNGLNIDGNDSATNNASDGLRVMAGHFIVSNALVAVNKGAIVMGLSGNGPRDATDGIYLGHSVYSRGHDLNGTLGSKTAYPITVGETGAPNSRGTLFLFDNTPEVAFIAGSIDDIFGQPVPKIVIANNVANYKRVPAGGNAATPLEDDPTLVGALAPVTLGAAQLRGLDLNTIAPGTPLRLRSMPTAGQLADQNVSLKVQVGLSATDAPTLPTEVFATVAAQQPPPDLGITDFIGNDYVLRLNNNGNIDRSRRPLFRNYAYSDGVQVDGPPNVNCQPFNCPRQYADYLIDVNNLNSVYGYKLQAADRGRIAMLSETAAALPAGRVTTTVTQDGPQRDGNNNWFLGGDDGNGNFNDNATGQVGYAISGRLVQISNSDATTRAARVLFHPGYLSTNAFDASFNANGQMQGSGNSSTEQGSIAPSGNANQGFAAQGGFGGLGAGSASGASGNAGTATGNIGTPGIGTTSAAVGNSNGGTGVVLAAGSAAATGATGNATQGTGIVQPGAAGSTSGAAGNSASASGVLGSVAGAAVAAGAGNSAGLPAVQVDGGSEATPSTIRLVDTTITVDRVGSTLGDVLLGRRPAADADLGRSGAGGGVPAPIFQRRYRLGTSTNAAVCAPADLESQAGSGDARPCTPAQ